MLWQIELNLFTYTICWWNDLLAIPLIADAGMTVGEDALLIAVSQ